MRRLLLSFLTLLAVHAFAQNGGLQGQLLDDKGAPVRFVNVRLLKGKGAAYHSATLSDSTGRFSLSLSDTGTYFLQLTSIGYTKLETGSFTVTEIPFSKDFGPITLQREAGNMQNVTVTALRPTIVQLPDRMVVSIEGTAAAAGNTAFSLLAKSPGILIDQDGNIQLNGKAGVTVMIDGRLTHLSARDLRNMLESMSAENIKNIEIITNPSARYDAEGSSGILNINLKKNTLQGITGSVNTTYTYNFKQHGGSVGGNLYFKTGKWNSFLMTDFNRRVGGREATFTRIFYGPNSATYFNQAATGNFVAQGPPTLRLGTDYDINSKHSIGFIFNFNRNTAHSDFLTDTYIGNSVHQPTQFVEADNYSSNTFTSYTGNLHYTVKLDTLGTSITTDIDHARIRNRGEANFFNTFNNLNSSQKLKDNLYTFTPNGYQIYSAKTDFSYPYKKGFKVELGAKVSYVESDNDFRFYFNNSGLVPDPQRTNHFFYSENIYAGYMNWNGTISPKVSIQLGLRAEHTKSTGKSFTTGQTTPRSYLDFFPSVFLAQKVNDNYSISYSYSRRLSRPNYGNLNPFRSYRDPYTWTEGNPYLRPQYTHLFNISQTIRKQYVVQLFYQLTRDVMSEVPMLDVANAITIYTTANLDRAQHIGMTSVLPIKITKKWDTRNTVQLYYSKFNTVNINGPQENDQLFYSLQSAHTFLLPKDIRLEATFNYRGPAASGLYQMEPMHRLDLAFMKSFMNKKMELTISANDIFKTYRYRWSTDINGNVNDFDQYFRWRSIGVSLRYNFSKGQKVNVKQRNALEELNRT